MPQTYEQVQFPISFLDECYAADFSGGETTWKARPLWHFPAEVYMRCFNSRFEGKPAIACPQPDGYMCSTLTYEGVQYTVRRCRILWAMYHREWPSLNIRHLNGDRGDDRIENLMLQTIPQRSAGSRRRGGKLGIPNVKEAPEGGYLAVVLKQRFGPFSTITDAVDVRNRVYRDTYGDFARMVEAPAA